MLPTNKKAEHCLILHNRHKNPLQFYEKEYLTQEYLREVNAEAFHLYVLSNDELKKGDWIHTVNIQLEQVKEVIPYGRQVGYEKLILVEGNGNQYKPVEIIGKVIASTKSLNIQFEDGSGSYTMPSFSKMFIVLYTLAYNNGNHIKELNVEYDEEPANDDSGKYASLKLLDGVIFAKTIKTSWTKKEVEQLLIKCCGETSCEDGTLVGKSPAELYKWIEGNLT